MTNFLVDLFEWLSFWHPQSHLMYSLGAIMIVSYAVTSALVGFWGTIAQDGLSLKNFVRGAVYVLLNMFVSMAFYVVALSIWSGAFYVAVGATITYEVAVAVVVIKKITAYRNARTEKMMKWEAAYVEHTNNFEQW